MMKYRVTSNTKRLRNVSKSNSLGGSVSSSTRSSESPSLLDSTNSFSSNSSSKGLYDEKNNLLIKLPEGLRDNIKNYNYQRFVYLF